MAGRGGVHISYLVVALIICIVLIGFVVLLNQEKQELRDDRDTAKAESSNKTKQIVDLRNELNQARMVLIGDEEQKPDYESVVTWISEAGRKLAEAELSENPQSYSSLQDIMRDYARAVEFQRRMKQTEIAQRTSKDAELRAVSEQREELRATKDSKIDEQKNKINELMTTIEELKARHDQEMQVLNDERNAERDARDAEIASLDRVNWVTRSKLNQAEDRIAHLEVAIRAQVELDDVPPDGVVVEASSDLGYAWVNLGKQDRLRRGVIFTVFQNVKGGKRLHKGRIEVLELERDLAKCAILETYDPTNPIAPEDKVASPFYDKKEIPRFVIAGEKLTSNRLSLDELERRIENYGGVVEDEVKIDTSYLVALVGYESTPEFATARKLGIPIVRERELLSFIDL